MKYRIVAFALTLSVLMGYSSAAMAQPLGPFGGYGYLYALPGPGSTAAGSFMMGSAALTEASGEAAYYSGMAAVSYQDAYQHWVENQKQREGTYFEMRRMSASYRAENHVASPTPDQAVSFSKSRLPQRMTTDQLNPQDGQINWPGVLLRKEFADNRAAMEKLFADRTAHPYDAGRNTQSFREIRRVSDRMHDTLRTLIHAVSPDEFIEGNKFLNSLTYEGRFAPDSTVAAN